MYNNVCLNLRFISKRIALSFVVFLFLICIFPCRIDAEEKVNNIQFNETQEEYSNKVDDNFFYRMFLLDNGRKYFNVDDITGLMDMLSNNNYSHMQLAIGNKGLRFLLDDMSVEVGGVVYSSDDVSDAIHRGNLSFYDCGDKNELSQSDMDYLLEYAANNNLSLIPLLNSPGHMNALLYAMEYLGLENVAYKNSRSTIDLNNELAIEFTTKIIEKYVEYFASRGVELFNLGLDEYASDINLGYTELINENLYDDYINYVNNLARIVKENGLIPMAFNDGFYYDYNYDSGTFDTDILICYWHSGWGQYHYRSSIDLYNDGFKIINCNSKWYFVLGNPYPFYTYWTAVENARSINCRELYDQSGAPVNGAMVCLWADQPDKPYVDITRERLLDLISTFSNNNQDVFYPEESDVVIDNDDSFMANWLFNYGDVADGESYYLDDSSWQSIKVPHDYSSYLDYTNKGEAESGYLLGGVAWYRKHFYVDKELADKVIQIHFSGVYMNSTIYINGHELGNHPYGYTPFSYDLSDYINYGDDNVIAVKVNHKLPSSRWYSGSGIIRDVKLSIQNKTYIPENGIIIDTSEINNTKVKTIINSESNKNIVLVQTLYDDNYNLINVEEEVFEINNGSNEILQAFNSESVELWSIDNPNLYELRTDIIYEGNVIESKWNEIGYRTYRIDPDSGFYLNNENIKLKGVCLHNDYGALGTAVNESALERQLVLMKKMGANAIRTSHNPGNDQLFKLCNKLGLLVIEEAFDGWSIAKNYNYEDYSKYFMQEIGADNKILNKEDNMTWAEFDIKQMVLNSINNPCIIMYSLGNEIFEGLVDYDNTSEYINIAKNLINWIREIDDNHLITICEDNAPDRYNGRDIHNQINNEIVKAGGAIGYNYAPTNKYINYHNEYPDRPIFASEVASTVSSREFYESKGKDDSKGEVSSYGNLSQSWMRTSYAYWEDTISHDFIAGEFIWTGIDYTGEPAPWNKTSSSGQGNNYPKSSYFGVVDTAGFKKDLYYFYQSQWNDEINTLHILPNWNLDKVVKNSEGKIDVVVYSDAESVELFLNDESLGRKTFTKYQTDNGFTYQKYNDELFLTWSVDAIEGNLKAVAYDENGNIIDDTDGRSEVITSKKAKSIKLTAYKDEAQADSKSLFFICAEALDEDGNYVPNANDNIVFSVSGNASVIASDAGNPMDTVNMKSNTRNLYHGKALAIVQVTSETGEIIVKARSNSLKSDEIVLNIVEKANVLKPQNTDYPKSITEDMIKINQLEFIYDGEAHKPDISINGDKTLTENDYDIQVDEQVEPGIYQIIINGKNNYQGTIIKEFEIKGIMVDLLEVSPIEISLEIGKSHTLNATIKPDNANNKVISYESSDVSIATVDSNGKVTAKKAGTTTITVKTTDGSDLEATCKVTVKAPVVLATSISLDKTTLTLETGKSETLKATIKPDNTTDKKVTWTSSDTGVVSVDSNGKVTAKKAGIATISASTSNGEKTTCKITVKEPVVLASSISLDKTSLELENGKTATLKATIKPDNTTNKTVTWASSDTEVVSIDSNGKVTAKKVGTATITVKTSDGKTTTCKITVKEPIVLATSISLDKTSLELENGKTATLKSTIKPYNAADKKITWTSSDTSIATVDSNGKVTAKKAGTATITASTSNNKKATCKVTVKDFTIEANSVYLNKTSLSLNVGESEALKATILPTNTTDKKVTLTSSDTSIAIVDSNGKVTAKKAGTATITVKTSNGKTATCKVTVNKKEDEKPTPTPTPSPTLDKCEINPSVAWEYKNGKDYWYEKVGNEYIKQGIYGSNGNVFYDNTERGREIYDPCSNAWYWLDVIYDGAKAINKEVFMPYIYSNEDTFDLNTINALANESNTYTETTTVANMGEQVKDAILKGTGKWVRYDSEGRMIKGWYTVSSELDKKLYPSQIGNTYYYDYKTGLMAKGWTTIDGVNYFFDEITGVCENPPA